MLSVPSLPGENLGNVCENSRAGENPQLRLVFLLICSRILPNMPQFSPGYEGTKNMFYIQFKVTEYAS